MKKMNIDEERFMPFIEEGLKDIEENGTLTEEEFWKLIEDEEEGSEGIYLKKNMRKNDIRLHLIKCLGKISRRFIKI